MKCLLSNHIPHLQEKDIHLWVFNSSLYTNRVKEFEKVLSNDEIERAIRFRFREHSDKFILFRGCLRFVLARYLKITPAQIRFSYSSYGKPMLVKEINQQGVSFNQSHTIGLGLIAITQNLSIGVDIERIRDDFPYEDIAHNYFSRNEVSELEKLSQPARKEAFFNFWTRKEAFLKAIGCGLSSPLDSFDVSLPTNEGLVILSTSINPKEVNNWSIQNLIIQKDYSAALAIQCHPQNIFFFEYQDHY